MTGFYFLLTFYPWIKWKGYENRRNDHHVKKLLIVKQTLLVIAVENVKIRVWRIWIFVLGSKGWKGVALGGVNRTRLSGGEVSSLVIKLVTHQLQIKPFLLSYVMGNVSVIGNSMVIPKSESLSSDISIIRQGQGWVVFKTWFQTIGRGYFSKFIFSLHQPHLSLT